MVVFGGSDAFGVVIELGCSWIKAGYAGEEAPRAVIPSCVGVIDHSKRDKMDVDTNGKIKAYRINSKDYYVGDLHVAFPRSHMEIIRPIKANEITDMDAVHVLFMYIFQEGLMVDASENPVLLSESASMSKNSTSREKLVELLFKQFNVPAIYVARSPLLTGFSQGKASCLVVDSGAEETSVTPIIDGYILRNAYVSQPVAGNVLTEQCLHVLENELKIVVTPRYEVLSKRPVDLKEAPDFEPRTNLPSQLTDSFRLYSKQKVIENFKECVWQVAESHFDEVDLALRPARYFEFPDGYNHNFLSERYRIPEILFQPKQFIDKAASPQLKEKLSQLVGIHELVQNCINLCDFDVRATLCNNLIVCGANALIPGFMERFSTELVSLMPGQKFKISGLNAPLEKKFSAWIGGSILTSMGSFQQMWMSRSEYDENGPSFIEKRCYL